MCWSYLQNVQDTHLPLNATRSAAECLQSQNEVFWWTIVPSLYFVPAVAADALSVALQLAG